MLEVYVKRFTSNTLSQLYNDFRVMGATMGRGCLSYNHEQEEDAKHTIKNGHTKIPTTSHSMAHIYETI